MSGLRWFGLTLAFLVLAGPTRLAVADINNPDLLPLGERAAQLGNAGITTPTSEAAYFNPANLTRISTATISASGSSYQSTSVTIKDALVLGDDTADIRFGGFNSIPSAVISTYSAGPVSLATSVMVPEWIIAKGRERIQLGPLGITQSNRLEREVIAIGGSAAMELTPKLSLGLSIYGLRESEDTNIIFDVSSLVDSASVIQYSQRHEQRTSLAVFGVMGLSYAASETLVVGARVRSPRLSVAGSGNLYVRELVADAAVTVANVSEVDGFKTFAPTPLDLGVGASVKVTPRIEFVADVNAQIPGRAIFYDDSDAGESAVDLRLAVRASVGADIEFLDRKWLRLGLVYNPAAVESEDGSEDKASSFRGVTGGIAWASSRTTTSLGAFFLQGEGLDDGSEVSERHYGALLSTSYRL